MSNHQQQRLFALARFVKFREEKFGGVLFETRQERVFTLNATGTAIVKAIVSGAPDVPGAVAAGFRGTPTSEVESFVAALVAKGLVVERSE